MKKNDWILTATVGLYSFLFYEQEAGINFVIFNIALIAALLIRENNLLKSKHWRFAAIGSLVSALCIGYYGNTLSVIANVISLSLLSGLSINDKSSVVLSILFSFYSYFSSIVFMFLDWVERKKENSSQFNSSSKRILLVVIPVLITLLFFFMYRESSPLFNEFAKKINFDFISWNWITFTLGGLLLLYGFFHYKKIKTLSDIDENASNDLDPANNSTITLFGKQFNINDEDFSGKVLFILLNILLLTVNGLDINFLFIDHKLPKGVNYSQFVHQGTGAIITSIIIAIVIILFYFRGTLNFFAKSKTIKFLAYLWIIQNVFMLISTSFRNNMYIAEYGLTYKRIGVYIYLFLSALGLLTTFIKIMKAKSNIYLFRINGWLFYGVLVISSLFNWDAMITKFNIHDSKWLEKNYLLQLSDTNLPQLFLLQRDTTNNRREFSLSKAKEQKTEVDNYDSTYQQVNFDQQLSKRLYNFLNSRNTLQWKSWYYDNSRIHSDLVDLNTNKKIVGLNLSSSAILSLEPLKEFNNVIEMYLSTNGIRNLNELHYFPALKKVDLSYNHLLNVKGIETLERLEYLNLRGNLIYDYSPLYKLKGLKVLQVPYTIADYQYKALQEKLPSTKIVKS